MSVANWREVLTFSGHRPPLQRMTGVPPVSLISRPSLGRNDSEENGERARHGAANRRPRRLASGRVAKPKGVRLAWRPDVAREGAGHCARGGRAPPQLNRSGSAFVFSGFIRG